MASRKICDILWIVDSPYGTYTAGDNVHIFWDDSTSVYSVTRYHSGSTSTITSGNPIPVKFSRTVSGYLFDESHYKQETYFQWLICDGTTRIKHERKDSFPYFSAVAQVDHPSCSVIPFVCDLQFDSLPVVVDATPSAGYESAFYGFSHSDGSITVQATSSHSIKYKLNSDFEYNDGTGQTSGVFSSLPAGTYKIFARDSTNCLATTNAIVGIQRTYGTLYQLTFYDNNGHSHKTELQERGYSGSATDITGWGNSSSYYQLNGQGNKDKFVSILPGELTFRMVSVTNFQFVTLYTSDPEKYRIVHSIDGDTVFVGKMLPNQYNEEYKIQPYQVMVVASDGLPTLKDIPFLDGNGDRFIGNYKQIDLIALILGKLRLGISIRSACNLYALTDTVGDSMNTTDSDDPLDQAFVNVERYYKNTAIPTCEEVLQRILEPYGAQIIQWGNYWNILRPEERVDSFDYRVFDSSGVYVSNGTYNPVKDLKGATASNRMVWKDQDGNLRLNPGFGNVQVLYDLGLRENILVNGDFRTKHDAHLANPVTTGFFTPYYTTIAPDLTGFELISNGTSIQTKYEIDKEGNVLLNLIADDAGGYLLSETISLKMGNADQIKITYRFTVNQPEKADFFDVVTFLKARIMVTYGDYYLKEDGTWTTNETALAFPFKPEQFGKLQDVVITASVPDISYLSGANFNIKMYLVHKNYFDVETLVLLKAIPTTALSEGYLYIYSDGTELHLLKLTHSTDTANDTSGPIRPDDYNSSTNPYQWVPQEKQSFTDSTFTTVIDKIQVEFLNNGNLLPENTLANAPAEIGNATPLNKAIYHGSYVDTAQSIINQDYFVSQIKINVYGQANTQAIPGTSITTYGGAPAVLTNVNSADVVYNGFLKNSDNRGWVLWKRDAREEALTLQDLCAKMVAAQYNKPWRSLTGQMLGDILFSPIDTLRETQDSNRKYYPVGLGIDFRMGYYSAEFMDLLSIDDAAEFNLDFNLDFNS